MPVPIDAHPPVLGIFAEAAPARDPSIAVREEFDAAMRAGTRAALERFLRRHPESSLAAKARAALAKLPRPGR